MFFAKVAIPSSFLIRSLDLPGNLRRVQQFLAVYAVKSLPSVNSDGKSRKDKEDVVSN